MKSFKLTSLFFLSIFFINAQTTLENNSNKKERHSTKKDLTLIENNEVISNDAIPLIGERSEVPLSTTVTIIVDDNERKPKEKSKSNPK
jgi:hypothetical protein